MIWASLNRFFTSDLFPHKIENLIRVVLKSGGTSLL